jgi:hypothetical protein
MQNRYGFDDDSSSASAYGPVGRVVPADGDPEVESYRAALRERTHQRRSVWWSRSSRSLRRWAIALGALALVVVLIKPLVVFAAVVIAAVVGLILLGLLAAGALLLALRVSLGGRMAYYVGRGGAFRHTGRSHR